MSAVRYALYRLGMIRLQDALPSRRRSTATYETPGYDPADPITAFGKPHIPPSYTQLLSTDALKGTHIGVMTNLYGTAERHAEVNKVMDGVRAKPESG